MKASCDGRNGPRSPSLWHSNLVSRAELNPKLLIRAEPAYLVTNRLDGIAKIWANQTEVTMNDGHYIQETTPE